MSTMVMVVVVFSSSSPSEDIGMSCWSVVIGGVINFVFVIVVISDDDESIQV